MAKTRLFTVQRQFSAATCGSIPIISIIAIGGPTISRRSSITWCTGSTSKKCSLRQPSRPSANDRTSRDFPETSRWRLANVFADRLALFVLGVIAIIAAPTFRDYGLGWDDYTHSEYGDLLLAFYGSGFSDQRALSFVNLYKYGGGFDMAAALVAKGLPLGLFENKRLVGGAGGIVGLIATWRIGRRLGGPVTGLVALLLLATCPLYYGHMFMNAKDDPLAN